MVEVAILDAAVKYDKLYGYFAADRGVAVGSLAIVPFGPRDALRRAIVLRVSGGAGRTPARVKPISRAMAEEPVLSEEMAGLALWMKEAYITTYGDIIRTMVPTDVVKGEPASGGLVRFAELSEDAAKVAADIAGGSFGTLQQIRVLETLMERGGMPVTELCSAAGCGGSPIATLIRRGYVKVERKRRAQAGATGTRGGGPAGEADAGPAIPAVGAVGEAELTKGQRECINKVRAAMRSGAYGHGLIRGVTGSGKTEVYMAVIREALDAGRDAILLVPEISLTPQMTERFKARFGGTVAVFHSGLAPRERVAEWRRVRGGEARIAIGARSAVFAPVRDIGVIIIDEEHEHTYKSEKSPKYHAAEVARRRCAAHGAYLLTGSATPSVRSYHEAARDGGAGLFIMDERANRKPMPKVEIIDMREELKAGNRSVISGALAAGVRGALGMGRQAILLMNRRGHSTFVLCRDCGHIVRCGMCEIPMTYHSSGQRMVCHYCGNARVSPKACPSCGGGNVRFFGAGTQRVEEEALSLFPGAAVARMDADTTKGRGSHAGILGRFGSGGIDVLIGTQMVAKGHDFPNVTVVGIMAADASLGIQDYRATERTFQLIAQAAGRAGRAAEEGKVYVQAYDVDNYGILAAASHDYPSFYETELRVRERLGYPPFAELGEVTLSSHYDGVAGEAAVYLAGKVDELKGRRGLKATILGPSRSPMPKVGGEYIWRVVLKAADRPTLRELLGEAAALHEGSAYAGPKAKVGISVDINP